MSSPGSSSSSSKALETLNSSGHQSGLTHSTNLHSIDPVALIDERIKVNLHVLFPRPGVAKECFTM